MASPQTTPLTARKEELNRETERYKQAIEDQVSVLKQDAGKVTRTALIVGGAALGTYFIGRAIVNRKKKKRAKELMYTSPSAHYNYNPNLPVLTSNFPATTPRSRKSGNPVVNLITKQIALFLVAIAKQRIMAAIDRNGKHDHEQNTVPNTVK